MNDGIQTKNMLVLFVVSILLFTSISMFSGCINSESTPVRIQRTDQQFPTIAKAIATAIDGDVILCQQGIFDENVRINKSITLQGQGPDTTIIQANKNGDVITIVSDNVTIKKLGLRHAGNLTYPDVDAGIDIQSNHIRIDSVKITNCNYGIYLYGNDNISLYNVNITDNSQRGIYMNTGDNMTIMDCSLHNNTYGIYWNRITDSLVQSNQMISHDETGLYLGGDSQNNLLVDNTFTENNYGLHIKSSTINNITRNLFLSNIRGVYVCCGGRDNLIYQNIFLSNVHHAYGYQRNRFNTSSIGNYWDDYTGVDENNDGIGDTPYNATGGEEYGVINIDYLPMMSPS